MTLTTAGARLRRAAETGRPEPLLTAADRSAELGYSLMTLYRWRCNGTGPRYVLTGARGIRYRRRDIDRWLDSRLTA